MNAKNRRPGTGAAAQEGQHLSPDYSSARDDSGPLLTEFARYRKPVWAPVGVPFPFGGSSRVCPLCHVFITSSSMAVRLREAVPVEVTELEDSPGVFVSSITGKPFYADGHCPPEFWRGRWYVHARCWERRNRQAKR